VADPLLELETLVSMAALESHVRLSDVQALQSVGGIWLDSRDWCVVAARFVLGAGDAPEARVSKVELEVAMNEILNLMTFEGLSSSRTSELINVTNGVLSKLEDARRAKVQNIELELTVFALVESVKVVMFGRNLNIAERSGLRGLYQRERLLQQV
jgi:predicted DNA-binding protein (UPF0251 family)